MNTPNRMALRSVAVACLASLASLMASSAAQAQQAAPAKEAEKKEEPAKLETVTVTTNRRLEDQQKVSAVVQSINADQLRRDGVQDLRSLPAVVPGMSVANQEGNLEIYIRGVGTANNTELGDPSAAPHINGVYIPRPRGLGSMFFDLERAEINKGPQGTLYGRNAMAGALNIVTAKPKIGRFEGFAQAELANRNGAGAEVALNVPLGEDIAIRGALQWVKRDAGFKNTNTDPLASGLKPAGLEDNLAARLSLLWNVTDRLRVQAMADGGKETGTGYPGANVWPAANEQKISADNLDLRRVQYRGQQGEVDNKTYGLQTKFSYDFDSFGTELTLSRRSVDFYQRNASSNGVDFPGLNQSSDNYSTVYWQTISDSNVAELRFYNSKPSADLNWSAGLFAFSERQSSAFFSLNDPGFFYSGTEFTMPDVRAKSRAAFVDGNYKLTPETRVLGGLRYTEEEKSRFGIGGNYAFGAGFSTGCCAGTRLGTPGFVPALLDRTNFVLPGFTDNAQRAQAFLDAIKTPGTRDTTVTQLTSIANGTRPNGTCVNDPTILPAGVVCPPSGTYDGFAALGGVTIAQQVGKSSANYGDFRIGLEHDLGRDQMVYLKFSTGHKAGGFNDTLSDGRSPIYEPEDVRVLEAGTRNAFDFGGRRAVVNLTGFVYDYNNYVLQSLTCTDLATGCAGATGGGFALLNENAAKAKIKGLEAELRLPLSAGVRLDLTAVLLDAKISKGEVADSRAPNFGGGAPAARIDVSGNDLPQASRFSLTARLQQRFALGSGSFDWQIVASYRSSYYLDHFNNDDVRAAMSDGTVVVKTAQEAAFGGKQSGYATVNLGAGFDMGNGLRLETWLTNALDKQASQKRIVGGNFDVRFLNESRSFGLRARYAF